MREIKFEAIYQPTGEHFIPHEIDFKNGTLTGDWDNEIKAWCNFSLDGKTGDAILRQYTGLKDKNGKEIYESDVVQGATDIFDKMTGQVTYAGCGYVIDGIAKYSKIREELNSSYEVIGNVWDNAELLTEN